MNTEFETALEKGKTIQLSPQEKSDMKATLLSYAQNHPVRTMQPIPWYTYFRAHIALTAFILLVFMTGGGSAFAEKSFPGDVLYGVKTGVNEQVLGLFAVSSQSKAEWQLTLADRRLQEVEHVALTQDNAEETKHALIAQVDIHLKNAAEESQKDTSVSTQTSSETVAPVYAKKVAPIIESNTLEHEAQPVALMTTMVATDTQATSTDVKKDETQREKTNITLESATEQLRLAREKVTLRLGQSENKKAKIKAEIELIQARREHFEQKDKDNKQTMSDLIKVIDTEIKSIETLNTETELNIGE